MVSRKLGYEFFKMTHFAAVIIFVVTFFWHCNATLTSWYASLAAFSHHMADNRRDYFVATAAVYVPCYVYSWLRTCFEHGITQRAYITIESNGFTRIAIPTNGEWTPGQHCFLRFTSFGIFQAFSTHPFTICSSPAIDPNEPSEMVFYLRHQTGFTAKLYEYAHKESGVSVPVLVDGPYGGASLQSYRDSDHLLVVAGGSGAGWCLPFIERYLRTGLLSSNDDSKEIPAEESPVSRRSGPVSLRVVLATRDVSSRTWFLQTVEQLLEKYPTSSSSSIRVEVHLTGHAVEEIGSKPPLRHASTEPSISSADRIEVQAKGHDGSVPGKEFEGRPQLSALIRDEAAKSAAGGESLGVFVCGPETMLNEVRNTVAAENLKILSGERKGGIYLHSEHFSWA